MPRIALALGARTMSPLKRQPRSSRPSALRVVLGVLAACALLASCAPVGSARWCAAMKQKPKGDWTANETVDFAKHCVLNTTKDN